ncbi:MAG: heme ABC transporter permease [Gammaproteobacteria bacterium]|nr:heme ABC transporter permease [Gammaproteobacteria bacterium]
MWTWFHKLASPPHFYRIGGKLLPWFGVLTLLLMAWGLYGGLVLAPMDYQQKDAFRIIYVHGPSAWMSMFTYMMMAVAAGIGLIWRMKLAHVVAHAVAPIGAVFTFCALVTGSIWGKPMWGTWWVWDARLTSELLLLFLYLGYMALAGAFDDRKQGDRASAILAIVGVVNIPIIHYSVEWWNTLHQGPTVTKFDTPSISWEMLWPLLVMALAFKLYLFTVATWRVRAEILQREQRSAWTRDLK